MHRRGGAAGGSRMTGVLLCGDAPDLRALLCDALQSDPGLHVVGEADDGAATLALAAELQPDVVLLDIRMPRPGPARSSRASAARRRAPRSWSCPATARSVSTRAPRARCTPTCRR